MKWNKLCPPQPPSQILSLGDLGPGNSRSFVLRDPGVLAAHGDLGQQAGKRSGGRGPEGDRAVDDWVLMAPKRQMGPSLMLPGPTPTFPGHSPGLPALRTALVISIDGGGIIINHHYGLGQRLKRPWAQGVPTSSLCPEGQLSTQKLQSLPKRLLSLQDWHRSQEPVCLIFLEYSPVVGGATSPAPGIPKKTQELRCW
ncbi:uncharacterized protein LOC144577926 [Callithrix jacchus]